MTFLDALNIPAALGILYLCVCRATVMNGHTQDWVKLLCGLSGGLAAFSALSWHFIEHPFLGFVPGFHATPGTVAATYGGLVLMLARYRAWKDGVPQVYRK